MEAGSTPLGKIGTFYEIWIDKKKYPEYARFSVPWWFSSSLCTNVDEAVKLCPNMDTEDRVMLFGSESLKSIFNSMFLEDFQQEFECSFVDSASSYITLDLIHANTPGMRPEDRAAELGDEDEESDIEIHVFKDADSLLLGYDPEVHGRIYLGYDVARRRDAAVVFVIGVTKDGKKRSVAEIEMTNKEFEFQLDVIRKIMKNLPVVRGSMDQTGQGEPLCETLQKEFGAAKIEGVIFSPESKEMLAIGVRSGLEKREFLLQNDPKFHKQIHSIKRMTTIAGRFRYDSQRDEQGHSDSFWAWALANSAIIDSVKTSGGGFYGQYSKSKDGAKVEKAQKYATPAILSRIGRIRS
ncbi:MAG: hypothetical protein ACOYM2_18230 [Rectinemataceae bacterium]